MRMALIIGVDYYDVGNPLHGCVNDAKAVKAILERHGDGAVNFDCKLLTATEPKNRVKRDDLKDGIQALFAVDSEIALFYFAGHGHIEATGGYILASDSKRGDNGIALTDVMVLANKSQAKNKIVVLDSCHSGIAGDAPTSGDLATLAEGVTVLTASTKEQYASEENGRGVFTGLFVDALSGGAADLTGHVTPGSVYAHIDQSLGAWEQRPVFKTNVKQFVSIRDVLPPIPLSELRRLTEFFPSPGFAFPLDPTFEPELKGRDPGAPAPNAHNTSRFAVLQKYNRLNLVVPAGAQHMWNAAMENKACKLTVLGEHYRRLVEKGRI